MPQYPYTRQELLPVGGLSAHQDPLVGGGFTALVPLPLAGAFSLPLEMTKISSKMANCCVKGVKLKWAAAGHQKYCLELSHVACFGSRTSAQLLFTSGS